MTGLLVSGPTAAESVHDGKVGPRVGRMMVMGSPPVPHPQYLITLVHAGFSAGPGVPGVAVRDAATGQVTDRLADRMDTFSAVAAAGSIRLFFLAKLRSHKEVGRPHPGTGEVPPGGVLSMRIDDAGKITDISAVPGMPEPEAARPGPFALAATADGSKLAYPPQRRRRPLSPRPPHFPVGPPDTSPAEVHIVTVATGEHTIWRADSDGSAGNLSLSADGRRMAFSWHADPKRGNPDEEGIHVIDLPAGAPGGVITAPSLLVIPDRNGPPHQGQSGLGHLGGAVISPDGSAIFVTAARYGSGGEPVTRLFEVSIANGQVLRTAYERHGADPANIIFGSGGPVIDASGQHALIGYSGNLARIDLATGQLTELPLDENGASAFAW